MPNLQRMARGCNAFVTTPRREVLFQLRDDEPDGERQAVAEVAASGARLIRRTLGGAPREAPVPEPCPARCGGQLAVEGGDGEPQVIRCEDCGRTWTEQASSDAV
ncbi:hypothetical protein KMT30_09130 [Streptomyces sp. IBSBF 2953]|nr:hypothetical protein [Streptomyces hayashii]